MTLRPATLKAVAERSATLGEFGRNFRDWLHELRRHSARPRITEAIRDEPPLLARTFAGGAVADAWLAAYAEHVAGAVGHAAPAWAGRPARVSPDPWFADDGGSASQRILALRDTPAAFKRRNLYTAAPELPLALRAGRPGKSAAEKRQANAERQRRFRARRREELKRFKRPRSR